MAKSLCSKGHYVVPRQKLCPQCRYQAAIIAKEENLHFEIETNEANVLDVENFEEEGQLDNTI